MSKEAERKYLVAKFKANMDDFGFPIALPNQPFDIPKNAIYGEFHILSGPKPAIISGEGKGKARVRRIGFVQLNVWIPKDKGTKGGTTAEDTFSDIFQMKVGRDEACSVYCFGAIQSFSGQTKVGYEVASFRVPYHRDSVEDVQVSL